MRESLKFFILTIFLKIFWLSMLIFAGWRVTSDFSLKVLEEDTRIAITCNAISQGHFGDTMMKKAELTLTVLSKWMNTLQTRQGLWKTSVNLPWYLSRGTILFRGKAGTCFWHSLYTLVALSYSQLLSMLPSLGAQMLSHIRPIQKRSSLLEQKPKDSLNDQKLA